jgi:hypothetical protein
MIFINLCLSKLNPIFLHNKKYQLKIMKKLLLSKTMKSENSYFYNHKTNWTISINLFQLRVKI